MSTSSYVYTGRWVNHSHGTVLGATITLGTRDAALLLALLAIVVSTAGTSFWTILSYVAHQSRSKPGPHDAIFCQEQAILKNSESALSAAWMFSRDILAWRKHRNSRKSRSLFFIAMALALAALFGVASIFSSQVTKAAGSEVLLNSENCGFWSFNVTSTLAGFYQEDLKSLNETIAAANYASTCYSSINTDTPQCSTYVTSDITWTTNQNVSCPFASGTCLVSPTAAYQMDTGPMDSHDVLGLNAKSSERVTARKVATCAPVHVAPYVEFVNVTLSDGNTDTFALLYLGDPGTLTNFTYEYDLHSQYINLGYDLQTITTFGPSSGSWSPIQAFNRTDADVSMFFLAANNVGYTYSNDDPIFGANKVYNTTVDIDNTEVILYSANDLVSAIACTDQYQICNPNLAGLDDEPMRCTPLGPVGTLFDQAEKIGLNLYQYATVETIAIAMGWSSMFQSVTGRGASALKAQSTVFGGAHLQVAPLPNNQWQIELSNWFAVGLATLQQYLIEKASGPTDVLESGGTITRPNDTYEKAICQRQMIRNVAGYQNFSTLGVAIILTVGPIIVVLGLVIDSVTGWIQKRMQKRDYQRLSWISDGYLQLQRLAYEEAGYDVWESCADEVPVSRSIGQAVPELTSLDVSDSEHPCLGKHATTVETSEV